MVCLDGDRIPTLARWKALRIVLVLKLTSISAHAASRARPSLPATLRIGGILSKRTDGSEERKEGVLCQHDDSVGSFGGLNE